MKDTNPHERTPPRARPAEDDEPHGPGGMDAIDEEPVRAPDDEEAPGGMTGIPDPDDD
jgi:hypothetical protein